MVRRTIRQQIGHPGAGPYLDRIALPGDQEMSESNSKQTAQNLMAVHGLRAQAVVNERIAEARQQGDASGLERWQDVEAAIGELRRSGSARAVQL
jgi:hypothetical protein